MKKLLAMLLAVTMVAGLAQMCIRDRLREVKQDPLPIFLLNEYKMYGDNN